MGWPYTVYCTIVVSFNRAAGGKPVDVTPEDQKLLQAEMERIDNIFQAGPDFMKVPTFNFTGKIY